MRPVWLAVTTAGNVRVGCVGTATMVQVAVPAGAEVLPASVTVQERWTWPEAPAVKVTLVPVVLEVRTPPVMVQA